jgi:hypothetical protein
MIAAEMLADRRKGTLGDFTAQIHRDLPAERNMLSPFFGFEIGQADMKELGNRVLNYLNIRLALMGANEITQRLLSKINRDGQCMQRSKSS